MTRGDIRRAEWERSIKLQKIQKSLELEKKKYDLELAENLSGSYKRLVIDSYLSAFGYNYGEDINYDNFDRCFKFSVPRYNEDSFVPSFTFNESSVEFKSDINNVEFEFNQNSVKHFITGDDIVIDNILSSNDFSSKMEKESYIEGNTDVRANNINSNSIDTNSDGMFIAISSENRYGEFNKINKTRGFSTVASVRKSADEQIKHNWESQKKFILKKMENRRK